VEWKGEDGSAGTAAADRFGMVPQGDEILRVRIGGLKAGGKYQLRAITEAADGKELARVEHGDGGDVNSAAFSPDGRLVVTASGDKTARVFEAAGGKELARVEHGSSVRSAAFSPDGASIITTSWDRFARLLRVWPTQQHLVNSAVSRAPQCLTPDQRKDYFLTLVPPLWCLERKLTPYHTADWQAWLPKQKAWLASGRQGEAPALPKSAE
jgi:WD40 repeat protein